jgi:DNA polymerase V
MDDVTPTPKSIVCSRSFGRPVASLEEMIESISLYCSKAIKSLRNKKGVAKNITVFITTNPFKDTKQYANYKQGSLSDYSAYTPEFISLAVSLLKGIYKEGYQYKKSGVMLTDMKNENRIQPNLFNTTYGDDKRKQVMDVVDAINHKNGKDMISFASSGSKHDWQMKREMVSPRYTTRWDELKVVK